MEGLILSLIRVLIVPHTDYYITQKLNLLDFFQVCQLKPPPLLSLKLHTPFNNIVSGQACFTFLRIVLTKNVNLLDYLNKI